MIPKLKIGTPGYLVLVICNIATVCLPSSCVIGTIVVSTGVFTVLCLFYAMMDLTGRPAFLTQYKIQDNELVKLLVTFLKCI